MGTWHFGLAKKLVSKYLTLQPQIIGLINVLLQWVFFLHKKKKKSNKVIMFMLYKVSIA